MSPASKRLRREGSGEKSSSPGRRAVLGKQRPVSPQFTLWFDGPRAMRAFFSCFDALSPCSYKVNLTGDHYEISFDTIATKRRNSAMKGKRK